MKFISTNKRKITVCALAVLVLMLPKWQLAGVSVRTWLVYLYTLGIGLLWIYNWKQPVKTEDGRAVLKKKKWILRKWNLLDSLLIVFLTGNVFQLVRDSLRDKGIAEENLLVIVLVMLFFLLSGSKETEKPSAQTPVVYIYIDVFLGCGFVVYMELLLHFLLQQKFTAPIALLLNNEQALLSFLMLMVMLSAEGYYRETDRGKRSFYMLLAIAGYFLLFLQKNLAGILLGGMSFLVSILVRKPAREQIKRISQLAFAYFFLLSNMSLLQQFIPALRENGGYDMEGGVYLELILAVSCVAFFSWWEKLPAEEKYLPQYKKWISRITVCVCVVLLFLLISGNRLAGMTGKSATALYGIAVKLQAYCAANDNTFAAVLRKFGLSGVIWLIAVLFIVIRRIWERSKRGKLPPVFMALLLMYLLQACFFAAQAVTAPVYVVLLTEILYGECTRVRAHTDAGNGRSLWQVIESKTKGKSLKKSEERKGLENKIKVRGILFLIAFFTCFFITGMEALATAPPQGGEAVQEGEPAQEEPVTGMPIDRTTLMYAVEKVNVRKGPGTDAEILGELGQGEMVFAVELLEEGWYRIVFGGETGYVRRDFLAVYGTAGEWQAPEHPVEPDKPEIAAQDSAVTGKKTTGSYEADEAAESGKSPASTKTAKDKKGNISTIIIIVIAVLLIAGYSVFQIIKEKQENEKGQAEDGEDGQASEAEAWDSEAETGEGTSVEEDFTPGDSPKWETGEFYAAEDSTEWNAGAGSAAAGHAKKAGKAENPAEDELVILDIDEV